MEIEIKGVVARIFDSVVKTSKKGNSYSSGGFLLDVSGESVYVGLFGDDMIESVEDVGEGGLCVCILEIKSVEYGGRYYTNVNLKRIDVLEDKPVVKVEKVRDVVVQPTLNFQAADATFIEDDGSQDLPF